MIREDGVDSDPSFKNKPDRDLAIEKKTRIRIRLNIKFTLKVKNIKAWLRKRMDSDPYSNMKKTGPGFYPRKAPEFNSVKEHSKSLCDMIR